MNVVRKILGPKSKYDKSLPYTYEARIPIIEGDEIYNHYLSDKICSLIEYLNENGIKPEEVQLFEVYQNDEFPIKKELCLTQEGQWLCKPQICCSLKEHYKGHIEEGKCSFKDRGSECVGP